MELWLKKIISALLLPLPIIIILLAIGLILLWFTNYKLTGKIFSSLSLFILLFFSVSLPANSLLSNLESRYQPQQPSSGISPDRIVVLGGGLLKNIHHPQHIELSSATLARLLLGILLAKRIPHSQLILSGGRIWGSPAEATLMENVAKQLGIPSSKIILDTASQDTHQQGLSIKKILGNHRFILVTSASHMPRAMAIFHYYGLNPIPEPTQYLGNYLNSPISQIVPSANNLVRSDIALHEYIGLIWTWYNNRITY